MDVLKNKTYKQYEKVSRYNNFRGVARDYYDY